MLQALHLVRLRTLKLTLVMVLFVCVLVCVVLGIWPKFCEAANTQ